MISDSIKKLRKENNISQDELAEKLGVSRQSVSLWETGQTQPTIENIVALSKIFNVSSDVILGNDDTPKAMQKNKIEKKKKNGKKMFVIPVIFLSVMVIIIGVVWFAVLNDRDDTEETPNDTTTVTQVSQETSDALQSSAESKVSENKTSSQPKATAGVTDVPKETKAPSVTQTPAPAEVDLFAVCKDFAIKNGHLNGDYTIYQQTAANYGGVSTEYFSISYWAGSDMVEFCLHCPLSETQSINFYLRMRGGYNKKYEYVSSKYRRETGESIREVSGYIDPTTFYDGYPLGFDKYIGSVDGQTEFIEESRVGICDTIRCLKRFVEVEKIGCKFSDFDFKNF